MKDKKKLWTTCFVYLGAAVTSGSLFPVAQSVSVVGFSTMAEVAAVTVGSLAGTAFGCLNDACNIENE